MKNIIKILLFLAYTISIFIVKQNIFPLIVLGVNLLLTIILKISIKEEIGNLFGIIIFVLLTILINSLVVNVKTGILIGIKLILVCNITFIFSKQINYMELADGLEKIFSILKFIKLNPRNISIIICIGITFVPTIKKQIKQIQNSLLSKGVKINLLNFRLIFEPLIISLLKRVSEIENALKAKAYQELTY